jgi:hypothetical protein
MNRPEGLSLDQLWSEKDLCERFGLPMGKSHSVTVGYWIRGGLKCTEISGRRFFWENDIIEFLLERSRRQREA